MTVDFLHATHPNASSEPGVDESDLARKMAAGDDAAFEQLFDRYFKKIYAYVVRRVGHPQTAEDIVSDVFLKAFAHRKTFVLKTSFSAWIYRIATNAITDHYRTKKTHLELEEGQAVVSGNEIGVQIDVLLLRTELEGVLEKLPERERTAVSLKYYGGLKNTEIAQVLRVSDSNIGVILHRALKKCEESASDKLKTMFEKF